MNSLFSFFLAATLGAPSALADEAQAETCVRTKVWDGYADGWAIRTMTSTTLESGKTKSYLVTFYPGKEYFIQTCGDDSVTELEVLLYDADGKVVQRSTGGGKEPTLLHKTEALASYYVVVHARSLKQGASDAGVSVAVTYR